jgi:hypothetical protein
LFWVDINDRWYFGKSKRGISDFIDGHSYLRCWLRSSFRGCAEAGERGRGSGGRERSECVSKRNIKMNETERESDKYREVERKKARETKRGTDNKKIAQTHTHTHTEQERGRLTEKEWHTKIVKYRQSHAGIHTKTDGETNRKRKRDRQTERHRQRERQTER